MPPASGLLHGIDVSHWQGQIDWPRVAAARRVDFAYVKVSEGASKIDPLGHANLSGARGAGLRVGAYHYLSGDPAEVQAAHFLKSCAREPSDLPPALDLETAPRGEPPAALVARALAWLRAVEGESGVRPVVYTFPSFARSRLRCPEAVELAAYGLWVAHWRVPKPDVPAPWRDWTIWQHLNSERVDGVAGDVDADCMRVPP